jgi:carboxyl-terminal processing protease
VAVLTNRSTASSGEVIVVAFRGRPHTRSFGAATYGVPTGNETMRLSDGAMLVLTTVWFVDRTNARYEGRISPDQFVNERTRSRGDPVLTAATRWLRTQPGCP